MSTALLLVLSLLLPPASSAAPTAIGVQDDGCNSVSGTRISLHEDDDRRRMLIVDRDHCLDVRSQGRVQFTDDDSDLARLSPGGFLTVSERRNGTTRRMAFDERGGEITRRYTVDGSERPVADAASWLRTLLPQVARESTIGAESRVSRILRQRGPAGVLQELPQIHSESIKALYLDSLFADRRLTTVEVRELARTTPRTFSSDTHKERVLRAILARGAQDEGIVGDVLEATRGMSSDRQRGLVLRDVLQRGTLSQTTMLALLRSTTSISSDREKAQVLIAAAAQPATMNNDGVRQAFLGATRTISSSSEYRRVMEAVVR
jgi:hypothetical protein